MKQNLSLLLLALVLAFAAAQNQQSVKKEIVSKKVKNSMPPMTKRPRFIDQFSTGHMVENGEEVEANTECRFGLGWVYFSNYCYIFTSYHENFLSAEELCNEVGGYLADVVTQEENDFIKGVLNAINPKDGTDYWIGGMDNDRDKGMQWITGAPMDFVNFVDGEPNGKPYTHMDFDTGFAWNTKDDADDQDNGFVCKRAAVPAE